MRIFDCFMFYDEEVVLDIRLNTLKNSVDCFVIVESKFYHNGKKRDLKFDINKYPKFKDKIIYIVQDEEPLNLETVKKEDDEGTKSYKQIFNAHKRENFQRNQISKALDKANEDDLILISDVDEIPNLDSEDFKKNKNDIVIFNQLFFYFKFNLLYDRMLWPGTKGCRKKNLKSFSWLRNIKFKKYPIWRIDTYFSNTKYSNLNIINDGGWHFTNLKSPEDMFEKFMNFGHHDEFKLSGITVDKIRDKISKREMFYDHFADKSSKNKWDSDYKLKKIDTDLLPRYLTSNREKYLEWFDI